MGRLCAPGDGEPALAAAIAGSLLAAWAMWGANPFFSGVVRIQRERGHRVMDTGPYRLVKHTGHAGARYPDYRRIVRYILLPGVW